MAVNDKIHKLEDYVAQQHFDLLKMANHVVQLSQAEEKLLDDPIELAGIVFDLKPDESGRLAVRGGPVSTLVTYLTYFRQPGTAVSVGMGGC